MSKKVLLILTILFLTTTLAVLVVAGQVNAADDDTVYVCPKDCKKIDSNSPNPFYKKTDKTKVIRMQISIPGVTHSCTYKVKTLDGEEPKTCYYIEANLPLYIKKVYNFSIGIIAIIAVVMIMIGGMQWIFAAGNPGTIGDAKSKITAAVSGLILALCSWVILNTINPSLTELKMEPVTSVSEIKEAKGNWCDKKPDKIKGQDTVAKLIDNNTITYVAFNEFGSKLKCGTNYDYGYLSGSPREFKKMGECSGRGGCGTDAICASINLATYCINPVAYCETYDKRHCDQVDKVLQDIDPGSGCAFKTDKFVGIDWLKADDCVYGFVLICNAASDEQISCFDPRAEKICWEEKDVGDGKKIKQARELKTKEGESVNYCVEPGGRGINNAAYICCLRDSSGSTPGPSGNTDHSCANLGGIGLNCGEYYNKYECERDRCGLSETGCKWEGGSCVRKE